MENIIKRRIKRFRTIFVEREIAGVYRIAECGLNKNPLLFVAALKTSNIRNRTEAILLGGLR